VEDEFDALDLPEDDTQFFFQQVLDRLSPDELDEWRRQMDIVIGMVPEHGSFEAAIDAFEREHPEAA
jgi:hypothetical protein